MRILYLNPPGHLGGAETSLLTLFKGLAAIQPSWKLGLLVGEDGPFIEEARRLGVDAWALPFPPSIGRLGESAETQDDGGRLARWTRLALSAPAYGWRLRQSVGAWRPNILHSNGIKMHLLAGALLSNTPLLWHIHDYAGRRAVTAGLMKRLAHRPAAVVANSDSVADDFRNLTGRDANVTTVYNGVDLNRFEPKGPALDLDAACGLSPAPAGTVRVGLVATFARWKGHLTFLEAIARLSPRLPVRAYIVGGPIYQTTKSQFTRDELQAEAARLGIAGRVGFTGHMRDVPAALRSLDIVVHASTAPEPFGMVLIEALACGRALIASNAGGAREIVSGDAVALAHEPGDAAMLSDRIQRLADSPELRHALGEAGRRRVEQVFSAEAMANSLARIYQGSVKSDGLPVPTRRAHEAA